MTITNNFYDTVQRINQLIGPQPPQKGGEGLTCRISMTCTPRRKEHIETRSNNTSRYLRMAVDLLESFIPHDGQITEKDIATVHLVMAQSEDVSAFVYGTLDPGTKSYIEQVQSRYGR